MAETTKGLERTSSISVTDCWNATLTGGRPEKFALLMLVPLSCVKLLYVTTGYTSRTEAHKTLLAAPCESRQEFNQGTAVRLTHRHPPVHRRMVVCRRIPKYMFECHPRQASLIPSWNFISKR